MSRANGTRSTDLFDVVVERSSVRAFREDSVPAETIRAAIEAAGWAPSPHGTQPWRFAVVESRVERAALAERMASSWRDQLALDGQEHDVIEKRVQLSKDRLQRAPFVIVLCLYLGDQHIYPDKTRAEAERLMAIQSLGAAAQNLLLALHARGLDAGWMCAPLFCPAVVREALGFASTLEPHAMFPVGLAARSPRRRPRRPVDELIADWR